MSDYDPESELMKLCDRAGGPPVKVSDDLYDILARAKAMAERSGGALDPTIAPVVRLWRRARGARRSSPILRPSATPCPASEHSEDRARHPRCPDGPARLPA